MFKIKFKNKQNYNSYVFKNFPILIDQIFQLFLWFCGLFGLLLPMLIFIYIGAHGIKLVDWTFLSDYPRGTPLGSAGGILPAIKGSFFLALIGLLISFPLALCGGIYLAEFDKNSKFSLFVRFSIECLAAVPAIIYGLFGYAFLVIFLKFGISLISGGIVLALLMFPIILITVQEAFLSIENSYRESALSLGITYSYLIRKVLFPKALPTIISGVVLAIGHAISSASPVLFTASIYFSTGHIRLDQPVMTLPTHLYYIVSEAISLEQGFGTSFVLITGLLIFNSFAMLLRKIGRLASK